MKVPKLAKILGLVLIVAATALPAAAVPKCSCDLCLSAPPTTPCIFNGRSTCLEFLIVALCPVD